MVEDDYQKGSVMEKGHQDPIVFRIMRENDDMLVPEANGQSDDDYLSYLDKQIARTKVELVHAYTLLRSARAGKKRKLKKLQGASGCPSTVCDQCHVPYPERMCRPYQLDTSWPEVNICGYCRKLILISGGVPDAYRRWFPERFDEYGRVR